MSNNLKCFKIQKKLQYDIAVIGGGMFDLNYKPVKFINLCHKNGVKYYVGLERSNSAKDPKRFAKQAYLGRNSQALYAGADGVYYFNQYNNRRDFTDLMIGTSEGLKNKNKRYFACWSDVLRGVRLRMDYVRNGERFSNITLLSPDEPINIPPSASRDIKFYIGNKEENTKPSVQVNGIGAFSLKLNGKDLKETKLSGFSHYFDIAPEYLSSGKNIFTIKAENRRNELYLLKVNTIPPVGKTFGKWMRLSHIHNPQEAEKIVDGSLLINDTVKEEFTNSLVFPMWYKNAKVNFDLKLIESDSPLAVCARFVNFNSIENLSIQTDKIALINSNISIPFNTKDSFHHYEVSFVKNKIEVKVDDKLMLEAKVNARYHDSKYHVKTYKKFHSHPIEN